MYSDDALAFGDFKMADEIKGNLTALGVFAVLETDKTIPETNKTVPEAEKRSLKLIKQPLKLKNNSPWN